MSNLSPDFHSAAEARLQADYDADASLTERLELATNEMMESLPKIFRSAIDGVRDDLPYAEVNATGNGCAIKYMTLAEAITDLMADVRVIDYVSYMLRSRYFVGESAIALADLLCQRYAEIHATSLAEAKVLG